MNKEALFRQLSVLNGVLKFSDHFCKKPALLSTYSCGIVIKHTADQVIFGFILYLLSLHDRTIFAQDTFAEALTE